jgi:hypothetical protein
LQPAVLYFNTAAHARVAQNPKVGSVSDTHHRRKTSTLHAPPARAASAQVRPEQRCERLRAVAFRPPSQWPAPTWALGHHRPWHRADRLARRVQHIDGVCRR